MRQNFKKERGLLKQNLPKFYSDLDNHPITCSVHMAPYYLYKPRHQNDPCFVPYQGKDMVM